MSDKIKIRMIQTTRPDLPFIPRPDEQGMILYEGKEYDAVTNPHGAISGICENGKQLGIRPKEFEFIEAPEWVLKAHSKYEMIRLQKEIEELKKQATCGCGICLAHNNMICPKYKPLTKAEE